MLAVRGGMVVVRENELRAAIATILMISPDQVCARTSLSALDNSLGAAKLRLAVKRLGMATPAGFRPANFGELCESLGGAAAEPQPATQPMNGAFPLPMSGPRVGLDLQEISALPAPVDYWEHSFYAGTFSKSEIAYAIAQAEPRVHFAGFWSAKEALRKCDERFFDVELPATAVEHDPSGRPSFVWKSAAGDQRLPHSLSISHTAGIAMAVVMAIWPST